MTTFAWTPAPGTYKEYPPFISLTGNRLTIRGPEKVEGGYPWIGETVTIELSAEQMAGLGAALTKGAGE